MEDKIPGWFYKKRIIKSKRPSAMVFTDAISYLRDAEIYVWLYLIKRSNITLMDEGFFFTNKAEIMENTGFSKITVQNVLENLTLLGYISRATIGRKQKIKLCIRNLERIDEIIAAHPGIAHRLRDQVGEKHVMTITALDVERVCLKFGIKFTKIPCLKTSCLQDIQDERG